MHGDATTASSVTDTIIDTGVLIVAGNSVLAELYGGFHSRFQKGRLRPALFLSDSAFPNDLLRNKFRRLCVFAHLRAMAFLIQAAVLAKARMRKGREGETPSEVTTTAMTKGKWNMANGK